MATYVVSQETHQKEIIVRRNGELLAPYVPFCETRDGVSEKSVVEHLTAWCLDNMTEGDTLVVAYTQH